MYNPWFKDTNSTSQSKGHFKLRLLVKQTKDSSHLIGGEQKFVHLVFTLKATGQQTTTSKTPTWQHFLGVLGPRVCPMEEILIRNIYRNPNSPQTNKFSFQTYTKSIIYIF
jgi:hypothetical protein